MRIFTKYLENKVDLTWIIDNKLESKFNPNSTLDELAEYLILKFKLIRHQYGAIKFSLNQTNYDNLKLALFKIGIKGGEFINVETKTYLPPPGYCSTRDRNIDAREILLFKLTIIEKFKFILDSWLENAEVNGLTILEILEFILAGKQNPIEIKFYMKNLEEIRDLNDSYLNGIKKRLIGLLLI